jgi:hypothetical protein
MSTIKNAYNALEHLLVDLYRIDIGYSYLAEKLVLRSYFPCFFWHIPLP